MTKPYHKNVMINLNWKLKSETRINHKQKTGSRTLCCKNSSVTNQVNFLLHISFLDHAVILYHTIAIPLTKTIPNFVVP